jgi:hypothetical protein
MAQYLKHTYRVSLLTFLMINIAIAWAVFTSQVNFSSVNSIFESLSVEDGLFIALAPITMLLLGGWLSANSKAVAVYWRTEHPLPGSRAFSELMYYDVRVNPDALTKAWGVLPKSPSEQNQLWYKMCKACEENITVLEAHKDWLFSRDLTGYALIFLLAFGLFSSLSSANWSIVFYHWGFLVLQYLVCMFAARTYGRRYVCNVLAASQ